MVAPEELADLLADPYRVACPNGHTALKPAATTPSAYCRSCRESYHASELVDRRSEPDACKPYRNAKD
ncbi:hypothetical protein [Halosimplex halophilum]|uniref:hypothetical protein n=1 Tax=Halosimplex halophilum TaxID=2559572 RepID=UPI00107F4E11|nr:hypothetical protein [Halosimplex halophilum]